MPVPASVVLVDCHDGTFAALLRERSARPDDDTGWSLERLELEIALDRDELTLFYQPIVSLRTGEVAGFEALLRWQHPARGLILPAAFVPFAESGGLIHAIGRRALERACAQVRLWNLARRADEPLYMAVNVSPRQLGAPDFVEAVGEILLRTEVDPAWILLEITESVIADDSDETMQTLARLRGLGLRLAIDDFGSGYSSLQYIRDFQAEVLKIDRAFVADLETDQHDWEIINAVVALAHAMGMRVVAEGVESGEQAGALRTLGADYAQGYHFSRPGPPDRLERLLVDGPPWMLAAPAAG
jgi:EAL domain-containing protein (putative c-di-GMP-specific phosphodiesterase class I)